MKDYIDMNKVRIITAKYRSDLGVFVRVDTENNGPGDFNYFGINMDGSVTTTNRCSFDKLIEVLTKPNVEIVEVNY